MDTDLKSYCEQMRKKKEAYRPWIILALLDAGGSISLVSLTRQHVAAFGDTDKARSARQRLRQAVKVLAEKGIAELNGDNVTLVARPTSKTDERSIRQICTEAINARNLAPATIVSEGSVELGKRG